VGARKKRKKMVLAPLGGQQVVWPVLPFQSKPSLVATPAEQPNLRLHRHASATMAHQLLSACRQLTREREEAGSNVRSLSRSSSAQAEIEMGARNNTQRQNWSSILETISRERGHTCIPSMTLSATESEVPPPNTTSTYDFVNIHSANVNRYNAKRAPHQNSSTTWNTCI
jgi:hypothetical protein